MAGASRTGPVSPPLACSAECGLGTKIHERFRTLDAELQIPDRSGEMPRAAEFDL